jgi:hypothetical protein
MTWRDLLYARLTEAGGVQVTLGFALIASLLVLFGAYCLARFIIPRRRLRFEVVDAEIELGGIGKIKIRPS